MSNLPISRYRALDGNGDPINGAKLYTYVTGTTTNKATYSDRALTSANANPVVADANGWFGEIYLTPDEAYKLVLKDASDVTIYTDDDVFALQLSNSDNTTRINQGFASPLDYPEAGVDAVGDGVADEYQQVQNAIDASTGVVDLLGKTFRCDSAVSLKSGLTIKNGVLDFTNSGDASYLNGTGSIGAANNLTANSARGDLVIDVTDGSGFAADDWALITSTATWDGGDVIGELIQVHSVAANALTLKTPVEGTYNTAATANVKKITMVKRVRFENVKLLMSSAAAGLGYGVNLQYCEDVKATECRFEGIKAAGMWTRYSAGVDISRCVFEDGGGVASSAGVAVQSGSTGINVDKCEFRRLDYGVFANAGDHAPKHVRVTNCYGDGVGSMAIMYDVRHLHVYGNDAICDTASAVAGLALYDCADLTVALNDIRESGNHGIAVTGTNVTSTDGEPHSCKVLGNTIRDCDNNGIEVLDMPCAVVEGNHIFDAGAIGINVQAGAVALDGALVRGNHVHDCKDGISVYAAGANITNTLLNANVVTGIDGATDQCIALVTDAGSTLQYTNITGNLCERDDDSDDNIVLLGGGAGEVNYVNVSGNTLRNGAYGLGEPTDANNTNVIFDNNLTISMATGASEGTVTAGNLNV